jgi:NAD(P)-dependent dehydrogenase (short-subunit alcohol dehydrogenase family)
MTRDAVWQAGDPVLVTGSSTGLGLETSVYLAEQGFKVYAGVRDLGSRAAVLDEAERRHVPLQVVRLDVTDRVTIDAAVGQIEAESGGLFGLINNAGIGLRGCLEDLEEDEIRRVFETNVFGTFALIQRALPAMRAAQRGRVVTITSVGGLIATFGLSAYCASKFALEGMGEALALELAPFGLRSVLVEPGIIQTTRWGINRATARRALDPSRPYHDLFRRHEALADRRVERSKTRPVDVARAVHRALTAARPRLRYVVGQPAATVVSLRRHLPGELFERIYFGTLVRQITRPEADTRKV